MGQTNPEDFGNGGTIDGDLVVSGDLQVSGGGSLSFDEIVQGTQVIDVDNTEALLVRKDGDGGDVFIVDTTNMDVTVNGAKNTTTLSVTNNWSTTNDFIKIALNDATIRSTVLDSGARNLILAPLGNDALTLHSTSGGVVSAGIGITPVATLHVKGLVNNTFSDTLSSSDFSGDTLVIENRPASSNDDYVSIAMATSGSQFMSSRIVLDNDGSGAGALNFQLRSPGDLSNTTTFMKIKSTGDVEIPSGSLGIGATPDTALEISGSHISNIGLVHLDSSDHSFISLDAHSSSHDSGILFQENGTTQMIIDHDGSDNRMRFHNGSTTFMNIDSSGNILFGATTAFARMYLQSDVVDQTGLLIKHAPASASGASVGIFSADNSNATATLGVLRVHHENPPANTKLIQADTNAGNVVKFSVDEDGDGYFAGNVGIGEVNPGSLLHLSKSVDGGDAEVLRLNNSAGGGSTDETVQIRFTHNGFTSAGILSGREEDFSSSANRTGNLIFKTSNNDIYSEKMRISADGSVSIGTTASAASGGAENLIVGSGSGSEGMTIYSGTGDFGSIHFSDSSLSNTGQYKGIIRYGHGGSGEQMEIFANANKRMVIDDNSRISLSNNDNNSNNTVFGNQAFNASSDNGSDDNTAIGYLAMGTGTVSGAEYNTAVGRSALTDITSANYNTAIGYSALANATTGERNTAIGASALGTTTNADSCVAIGNYAMGGNNATADGTVAIGRSSLALLTSGAGNTAVGYLSLKSVDDGSKCTAVGFQAGNTTEGATKSTFIGYDTEGSGANVNNETVIGADAVGQGGNSVTLGNADVTDVYMAQDSAATCRAGVFRTGPQANLGVGQTPVDENSGEYGTGYVNLFRDDTASLKQILFGKNGSEVGSISTDGTNTAFNTSSDYRLKENEVEIPDGLERLNKLKPYRFNWKSENDEDGKPTRTVDGLFAHEVAEIIPEAVIGEKDAVDSNGKMKIQSMDYSKVVPLLIKAVQELSAKVEELEKK